MTYDGVVLAGGDARRLGGITKPAIRIGARSLLDIALDALAGAATTVAVAAPLPARRAVTWTREEPAGGGPVAGLVAALPLLTSPLVVVLAADLPFITAAAVNQLVAQVRGAAAIAVDADGHEQPLVACYGTAALREAVPAQPTDASMRSVLRALAAGGAITRIDLGGDPPVTTDCDTAEDLMRAGDLMRSRELA